jgi:hypothetical protein
MKILLIEDSKFQRIANGRALVKAGYDVSMRGMVRRDSLPLVRIFLTLFCSI